MIVCVGLIKYLGRKLRKSMKGTAVSVCLARAVDRRTCQQFLDEAECKGLLVWSRDGMVCDIFLLTDPCQTHGCLSWSFAEELVEAAWKTVGKDLQGIQISCLHVLHAESSYLQIILESPARLLDRDHRPLSCLTVYHGVISRYSHFCKYCHPWCLASIVIHGVCVEYQALMLAMAAAQEGTK